MKYILIGFLIIVLLRRLARLKQSDDEFKSKVEVEQIRQAAEQEKLKREQEKQAAQIAKHEKRIADLEFKAKQADCDIEFLTDRIAQLDAQRDYLILQQSGTVPGGKEHTKYQNKILTIENQTHTAENKLNKAKHIKAMAEAELAS